MFGAIAATVAILGMYAIGKHNVDRQNFAWRFYKFTHPLYGLKAANFLQDRMPVMGRVQFGYKRGINAEIRKIHPESIHLFTNQGYRNAYNRINFENQFSNISTDIRLDYRRNNFNKKAQFNAVGGITTNGMKNFWNATDPINFKPHVTNFTKFVN